MNYANHCINLMIHILQAPATAVPVRRPKEDTEASPGALLLSTRLVSWMFLWVPAKMEVGGGGGWEEA